MTGILLAILAVLAFSVRPILIKFAYGYGAEPVTLLALRMGFSLPFFLAMALWLMARQPGFRTGRRDLALVAGLGFIGYYVASFLDFLGLQFISAGVGRLLLFIYPTVVVILSALFLAKPITRRDVASLVVTYAGVALVVSHALAAPSSHLALGIALVFGSAILYAVYLVSGSQVVHRLGSLRFTAYAMISACLFCLIQFLVLRPLSALDLPWQVYALSMAIAFFSTVLPVFMTAEALRRIGANQVAMIGALGPVSAIAFGWIGLDEVLTPLQAVGAFVVLAGVLLSTMRPRPVPVGQPLSKAN